MRVRPTRLSSQSDDERRNRRIGLAAGLGALAMAYLLPVGYAWVLPTGVRCSGQARLPRRVRAPLTAGSPPGCVCGAARGVRGRGGRRRPVRGECSGREGASGSEPRAALVLAQSVAGGGAKVKGERRPRAHCGQRTAGAPLRAPFSGGRARSRRGRTARRRSPASAGALRLGTDGIPAGALSGGRACAVRPGRFRTRRGLQLRDHALSSRAYTHATSSTTATASGAAGRRAGSARAGAARIGGAAPAYPTARRGCGGRPHALATLPGANSYVLAPGDLPGPGSRSRSCRPRPGRARRHAVRSSDPLGFQRRVRPRARTHRARGACTPAFGARRGSRSLDRGEREQLLGTGIEGLPAPLGRIAPRGPRSCRSGSGSRC